MEVKVCTHSGSFHADDVLGVAMFHLLFTEVSVLRSRDPAVWENSDFLVDVGGRYDAVNLFDHHQKGFSEKRNNGIPYAGAGLVWRTWGAKVVKRVLKDQGHSALVNETICQEVAIKIDESLLQYVDALDSGVSVECPSAFGLSGILSSLNPTWLENNSHVDLRFLKAVAIGMHILEATIMDTFANVVAKDEVLKQHKLLSDEVLVLETKGLPFIDTVLEHFPKVLFVVYPESTGNQYQVRVMPVEPGSFIAKKSLPESWAGLRDTALQEVTGVPDAVFCHNGRFIAGAQTLEGAKTLALLAAKD